MPSRSRSRGLLRALSDVGAVLLTWGLAALAEFVFVGVAFAALFAGNWELVLARKLVTPLALAMLVPYALSVVGLARLASWSRGSLAARYAVACVAGLVMGALAFGVSQGRHFDSLLVRAPFVACLASLAFALAWALVPLVASVLAGRRGRALSLVAGSSLALVLWLADARVLPRLYPAFHLACLLGALAGLALTVVAWRAPSPERTPAVDLGLGGLGLAAAAFAVAWSPTAARGLARSDNLRLVMVEHAPLLGRAVQVAARLSPPLPLDDAAPTTALPHVGEVPRALDWLGEDILLVSVDALRADHLGAYGYDRPTTPNLDAFARTAAVFERAYCPTPHTSYSVTSMMTGKAMRPLLSLGLGKDSDTWATYLRRYGYKTAAFYPPAVFYIDAERFTPFETAGLGFEYRWVEFTSADEKVREVGRYLDTAGPEPLFLWVHLFEPHEPYVSHEGHAFGDGTRPIDAYDSEVAYADAAIGELLRVVRAKRPKVTVVVTADHGEEFGDHDGRYHGTTCYEEQVRVPLLVAGPGVAPGRITTVVQTIDLLPTVLSALGIPRPARVRGRDLGAVLAGKVEGDMGLAYAETDDQTMLARGDDRLLCARKAAACALYDVKADPLERHDRSREAPALAHELRTMTVALEREQGRYEAAEVAWPEALRRGMQGEGDAAEDVAALLDDASVVIRRKAAEVTFRLADPAVKAQVARTLARDEDEEVGRWCALTLVRIGGAMTERAVALVRDPNVRWRRPAALAFALRGDPRGKAELAAWWDEQGPPRPGLDTAEAKVLLEALARIADEAAVPSLIASLAYVPLRAAIVSTLGAIQDRRAVPALSALLATERYEAARVPEARTLCALAACEQVRGPLTTFAGLPDPMVEAIAEARLGHLLDAKHGGLSLEPPRTDVEARVHAPAGARRLWVLANSPGGELSGDVDGAPLGAVTTTGAVHEVSLSDGAKEGEVALRLKETQGLAAVWVVPRLDAVPESLRAPAPDAGAK